MTTTILSPVRPAQVPMALASAARSIRSIARSPGLLLNAVAMSLFFMLIYSGQLAGVGPSYLGGTSFAVFIVPLILLTGAFLSAAIGGELLVRDLSSGYHDRLVLAHGSTSALLAGPVVATTLVFAVQALLTVAGAFIIGFRAPLPGLAALLGLTVAIGLCTLPFTLAAALRFGTSSAVNAVPTLFFGLSFFTGFLAPADQLGGWMRTIAAINPLTPVLDTMRATVDPATIGRPVAAALVLGIVGVVGIACCVVAIRGRRRTR